MPLANLLNQPLTIQKVGSGTNDYGDETSTDSGTPVAAVGFIEQQTSIENLNDRDTVITDWIAYLPAGADIAHRDYINFGSQKFQVTGEPENCYNPRTQQVSHLRMKLTVVNG